jgi:hypothetical protein
MCWAASERLLVRGLDWCSNGGICVSFRMLHEAASVFPLNRRTRLTYAWEAVRYAPAIPAPVVLYEINQALITDPHDRDLLRDRAILEGDTKWR